MLILVEVPGTLIVMPVVMRLTIHTKAGREDHRLLLKWVTKIIINIILSHTIKFRLLLLILNRDTLHIPEMNKAHIKVDKIIPVKCHLHRLQARLLRIITAQEPDRDTKIHYPRHLLPRRLNLPANTRHPMIVAGVVAAVDPLKPNVQLDMFHLADPDTMTIRDPLPSKHIIICKDHFIYHFL